MARCRKQAMTTPVPGARWFRVTSSVGVLLSLAACGGASSSESGLEGASGPVDCQSVISDTVTGSLHWPTGIHAPPAVVHDGRCERSLVGIGVITAGSLDGSGSATDRYDAECARLEDGGHADAELATDIVGGGTGCAAGLDEATQAGLAELVVLTQDDVALHLRVDAQAAVTPEQLRAGLRALAKTAQQAW
jgi:hypothetical protein